MNKNNEKLLFSHETTAGGNALRSVYLATALLLVAFWNICVEEILSAELV